MRIICTLFLTATVTITMKRCRAEDVDVAVDDGDFRNLKNDVFRKTNDDDLRKTNEGGFSMKVDDFRKPRNDDLRETTEDKDGPIVMGKNEWIKCEDDADCWMFSDHKATTKCLVRGRMGKVCVKTSNRVDCEWSEWAASTTCSATCGKSFKISGRFIKTHEQGLGDTCKGVSIKVEDCGNPKCAANTCCWTNADKDKNSMYKACVFPFFYQSQKYEKCTTKGFPAGTNRTWCYTEVDDKGVGTKDKWGYCDPSCQNGTCENKESWCDRLGVVPDCSLPYIKESCQKYCGLCGVTPGGKSGRKILRQSRNKANIKSPETEQNGLGLGLWDHVFWEVVEKVSNKCLDMQFIGGTKLTKTKIEDLLGMNITAQIANRLNLIEDTINEFKTAGCRSDRKND